jgi:hypothetical protein
VNHKRKVSPSENLGHFEAIIPLKAQKKPDRSEGLLFFL